MNPHIVEGKSPALLLPIIAVDKRRVAAQLRATKAGGRPSEYIETIERILAQGGFRRAAWYEVTTPFGRRDAGHVVDLEYCDSNEVNYKVICRIGYAPDGSGVWGLVLDDPGRYGVRLVRLAEDKYRAMQLFDHVRSLVFTIAHELQPSPGD